MLPEVVEIDELEDIELVEVVVDVLVELGTVVVIVVEVVEVVEAGEVVEVEEVEDVVGVLDVAVLELPDAEEEAPVVGEDEECEDIVVREEDEPEEPGASAKYPTSPPITIMPTITVTAILLAMPRFNAIPTRISDSRPYPTARRAEFGVVRPSMNDDVSEGEEGDDRLCLACVRHCVVGLGHFGHISVLTLAKRSNISESSAYAPTNLIPRSVVR
jgi:hypothetical protein